MLPSQSFMFKKLWASSFFCPSISFRNRVSDSILVYRSIISFQYQNIGLIYTHAYLCDFNQCNCKILCLSCSCLCFCPPFASFIQSYSICFICMCMSLILRHWFQNARCIWFETENVTFMRFQHISLFFTHSSFSFRLHSHHAVFLSHLLSSCNSLLAL